MSAIKVILVCLNILLGLVMLIAVGGVNSRGSAMIAGLITVTAFANVWYMCFT